MSKKREKFERLLLSSVSNLAMSFADSYIEKNVEHRANAGLKATVIRRQLGECCEWCQNLAGIYTADKLPADIYKRHANCRCMVTYKTEKVYTDAWSKKQFATEKEARLGREKEIKAEAAKREAEQKELRLELDRKVRASRSKESIERQRKEMLAKEKEILEEAARRNEEYKKLAADDKAIVDMSKEKMYPISPEKVAELRQIYEEDVAESWISSLSGFDNYIDLYIRVESEIVGHETVDGIFIESQTRHFLQRVIGTGEDPKKKKKDGTPVSRSGAGIEDIKDALFNGEPQEEVTEKGRTSKVYIGKKATVSINPKEKSLIQCNRI